MSEQPRRRPDSDSIPVPPDGMLTVGDRLRSLDKWTREHDEKDDARHESVMKTLNQREGQMQMGNIIAVIVGVIASAASIYAAFVK